MCLMLLAVTARSIQHAISMWLVLVHLFRQSFRCKTA